MRLNYFKNLGFLSAIKALLSELNVPFNAIADDPVPVREILKDTYKDNSTFQLIKEVYFVGIVDDAAFEKNESLAPEKIKSDYDGILFFGVILKKRENKRLPTRGQLAEISRAFNREFYYTPVVIIFKYLDNQSEYIAFANTERLPYKQEWREGEKAGKVSLLRDISIDSPHRGHEDIIDQLKIPTSGTKAVTNFEGLYKYWQEVFSVSILNRKFYQELSNWYFWAIKNVTFPNQPTREIAYKKGGKLEELIHEHNATNVIRLLTRLLFTWFIKEKKLIPEELFDLKALQKNILKDITPYHEEGMFKQANDDSVYYKAILQNLFFASLNCPIDPDDVDDRKRGFRGLESYGKHRGVDYLMRYEKYFKNPQAFLDIVNSTVPFLNGGLFECLDEKVDKNLYIDGFSDQMTKGEQLIVPDFLFFGLDEEVDLSQDYGLKGKKYKKAAVKGLINILKSYKFTVTENTPIEEDVALDPELLGKVFENLLASYNPETKTTARKQTGSFYTPREVVNYMVDESLIAYLKTAVVDWDMDENAKDKALHQLTSFDAINPFANNLKITKAIITALDRCKILDPACGSGAFPMGVLQKMVHILQKLDSDNELWKELQLNKALQATEVAYGIEDKTEREAKLLEINDAFDVSVNDPDYARKLYLIENCIYGVDIQPIATQISKLRFFISLVVDQKVNHGKPNFGIRALPNLETKFVTANTLIGIEKPSAQTSLFNTDRIKGLENELKYVRKKLFSARTKRTKTKYRQEDERLRKLISAELISSGWHNEAADMLAKWDPYDQNAASPFFDAEWMFDISKGFDIVIGNPPYIKEYTDRMAFDGIRGGKYYQGKMDLWYAFACTAIDQLAQKGLLCFIATNNWVTNSGASILREKLINESKIEQLLDFGSYMIFESASIQTMILLARKIKLDTYKLDHRKIISQTASIEEVQALLQKIGNDVNDIRVINFQKDKWLGKTLNFENENIINILSLIKSVANFQLNGKKEVAQGIVPNPDVVNARNITKVVSSNVKIGDGVFVVDRGTFNELDNVETKYIKPLYEPYLSNKFKLNKYDKEIIYISKSNYLNDAPNLVAHLEKFKPIMEARRENLNGRLEFFHLHWPRDQYFFRKAPKILSVRKCARPTFIYTEEEAYVMMSFNVIKTNRINMKYLVGLLNSKLMEFWLRYKGKMQGNQFQVDKAPLLELPIYNPSNPETCITLVNMIMYLVNSGDLLSPFEEVLDAVIFNQYFSKHMREKDIDVIKHVETDLTDILKENKFHHLSELEQKKAIEILRKTWSHPDNEVRNRIKLFAVRSPEILKPILES